MVPDFVHDGTEEMRSEMDPVADFLEDLCVVDPHDPELTVPIGRLWESFAQWSKRNLPHRRSLSRKAFGAALERRGIERGKGTGGVRIWQGIAFQRLANDLELAYMPTEEGHPPFRSP